MKDDDAARAGRPDDRPETEAVSSRGAKLIDMTRRR